MPMTGARRRRSWMPVTKKPPYGGLSNLAERGGFEPPRRYKRLPDFESGTFNRSATSPDFPGQRAAAGGAMIRSEEHTSELQSLMRISYAVFCLKKKIIKEHTSTQNTTTTQ